LPFRVTMKSSPPSRALITSPLLLRSSLCVSFRVIQLSVARVRRWNFAFQKGFAEASRQTARRPGRENAEQRAPRRHPCERSLQHANEQVALPKLPHDERRERPIDIKIGAEQDAARFDPRDAEKVLEEVRRHGQHSNRVTDERQRRGQALERLRVCRHRQVTCPSSRGRPQLGQVHRQPLL
jgi:hypothetical protein